MSEREMSVRDTGVGEVDRAAYDEERVAWLLAVEAAERSRRLSDVLVTNIRRRVERDVSSRTQRERFESVNRLPVGERERVISTLVDREAATNPDVKVARADNRWFMERAGMHAAAVIIHQNDKIISLLDTLVRSVGEGE